MRSARSEGEREVTQASSMLGRGLENLSGKSS